MKGEIPVEIGELSSLRILRLKGTRICRIPRTIDKLHHLQILNLKECHGIQELLKLPTSLTYLLLSSISLLSVPNLPKLTNLVKLLLSDGSTNVAKVELGHHSNYGESNILPGCDLRWIVNLSRLKWLELGLLSVPAPPELASLSHLEELVLKDLDLKPLVQLPSSDWNWRNLLTLEITCGEEFIPLEGLPRLEKFTVECCVRLQRLSIPSEFRKLRVARVSSCSKLVEIQVVGSSESLEYLDVLDCKSLTRISGLPYLNKLENLRIEDYNMLANVEGLNELESLKFLVVENCTSLRRLIDASCTKIPDDCDVEIEGCGYFIKDFGGAMKHYREEILRDTSNEISFTIRFHLGVKKSGEELGGFRFVGGIEREKEGVDPDSVTCEGLVVDVKNFGFRVNRMWYVESHPFYFQWEIKHDEDVNEMLE